MYQHLPMPRRVAAALCAGVDDSVGQIMNRLRERGLLDNTLVFFASDNGAASPSKRGEGGCSNAPYREYKTSLFEGGIRLPGIVSWPGKVPAGVVCDQPVVGMDIFATAAEAMGADLPKDRTIDGRSWFPLFKNPNAVHPRCHLLRVGRPACRPLRQVEIRRERFHQHGDAPARTARPARTPSISPT